MRFKSVRYSLLGTTFSQVKLCDFKVFGPSKTYRLLSHPVDLCSPLQQKSAENAAGRCLGRAEPQSFPSAWKSECLFQERHLDLSLSSSAVPGWDLLEAGSAPASVTVPP